MAPSVRSAHVGVSSRFSESLLRRICISRSCDCKTRSGGSSRVGESLSLSRAAVRIELEGPTFEQIEEYRRSQSKIPSRSEAVRRLLELALSARPDGPRAPELRRQPNSPSRVTTNSMQKFERVRPTAPT